MRICTFIHLFLLLGCFSISVSATNTTDSLLVVLNKASKDTTRVRLYLSLGREFQQDNPDTALFYFKEANQICTKNSDEPVWKNLRIETYTELSNTYNMLNNLVNANSFLEMVIEIQKKDGLKKELVQNLNAIVVNKYRAGQYEQAMARLMEALPIAQELRDKKGEAVILARIGSIFISMGNLDKSIEYITNALHIYEQTNDKPGISKCYTNLGIVYYENSQLNNKKYEKEMLDTALLYQLKSFDINQKLGIKEELVRSYTNISNIYSLQGLMQKSLEYNKKALELYEELGDKNRLAIGYTNMAGANITLADSSYNDRQLQVKYLNDALEYENKAFALAKETGDMTLTSGLCEYLKNIYKRLKQYDKALDYAELFVQYKDSLLNDERIKATTEMSTKYETAQKEQQIKMQEVKMKNEKLLRYFLIVGLLILGALAYYVFRNYKSKQKANRLLQAQKDEISAQAQQLELQNKKLSEMMQFKQGLTSMIVHDLKNPLNTILNIPQATSNERKLEIIRQSGRQMLNQVLNILDVDKYENAKLLIYHQPISLFRCSSNAVQQVSLLIVQKNISVSNTISETVTVYAEQEILERIFINLLTNAIKFTPTNGTITLSAQTAEKDENMINVYVTDTGTGIPPEESQLIFEKFRQINARNSGSVRSTGLGLTYCKMAVEAHGGTIWVESKLNEGSAFVFSLPLSDSVLLADKQANSEIAEHSLPLQLTPQDINYLNTFENDFDDVEFFEVSALTSILKKIDPTVSPGVQQWKSKMEDAIYVCNEKLYAELTRLIGKNDE